MQVAFIAPSYDSAVITQEPVFFGVTTPLESTVATLSSLDDHKTS